jgi:hypothetical protein
MKVIGAWSVGLKALAIQSQLLKNDFSS